MLSGRSQTTTFLIPLFFGLTISDSSSRSPLERQWALSWLTSSFLRSGTALDAGKVIVPLRVAQAGSAAVLAEARRIAATRAAAAENQVRRMGALLRMRIGNGACGFGYSSHPAGKWQWDQSRRRLIGEAARAPLADLRSRTNLTPGSP